MKLKLFLFLLGAGLMFFVMLFYQDCVVEKLRKENDVTKTEIVELEKTIKIKTDSLESIEAEYEALKNKPPEIIIETEVEYETVNKKQYVTRQLHEKIVKEHIRKIKLERTDKNKIISRFDNYIDVTKLLKIDFRKVIKKKDKIISNLEKIAGKKSSPLSFGFQATYGYSPLLDEFTWVLGLGLEWEIDPLKIIKELFRIL